MEKIILHIDMDAFYAAVEQSDNTEYKGKPVVIGANPQDGHGRGVVSTCSYEARKYGIKSAMPISKAYRLCPNAVFIAPRMKRYLQISREIIAIFNNYTQLVEQISVDEAFLDCTGSIKLFGSPEIISQNIKNDIYNKFKLTCSIGIASNKSIAKIASDLNKPDGLSICKAGSEKIFLADLPINKIWGVGKVTGQILNKNGIINIKDLYSLDEKLLQNMLGKSGITLWQLANGIDNRDVINNTVENKSISNEFTFESDINDMEKLFNTLFYISDKVGHRLRQSKNVAKTVFIKLRNSEFSTYTRNFSIDHYFDKTSEIYDFCKEMLNNLLKEIEIENYHYRLVGCGVTNLRKKETNDTQLNLFNNNQRKNNSDDIYDSLKIKYGKKIKKASLLD